MPCTVSPNSMSHTCMCVWGRVQCASERKLEAKQSKHTHIHRTGWRYYRAQQLLWGEMFWHREDYWYFVLFFCFVLG